MFQTIFQGRNFQTCIDRDLLFQMETSMTNLASVKIEKRNEG